MAVAQLQFSYTSQPSQPAEIRSGCADYDAARTKTARGAVTSRPIEAAMQPSMDVCAWIDQAQDCWWRPYVLCTPDVAMRTSLPHVYYPWKVFQRWRLRSPEGPLYQGSATPRCPEHHQVFPRPAATVSQARWRDGNNFRGSATNRNLFRED